jgi:hypothetical protein
VYVLEHLYSVGCTLFESHIGVCIDEDIPYGHNQSST